MALIYTLFACHLFEPNVEHEFVDEADHLCASEADGVLTIELSNDGCAPNCNVEDYSFTCEATIADGVVSVTSVESWTELPSKPNQSCDLMCMLSTASCTVDLDGATVETVVYSDTELGWEDASDPDTCPVF